MYTDWMKMWWWLILPASGLFGISLQWLDQIGCYMNGTYSCWEAYNNEWNVTEYSEYNKGDHGQGLLRPQWVFYVPPIPVSVVHLERDRISGWTSLSEETWKSNHLQMWKQRQHFLLNYCKTLSSGPDGVRTCNLPHGRPMLCQLH